MTDPVMASDLDWTIVRFTRPTNGTKTGRVRSGPHRAGRAGRRRHDRAVVSTELPLTTAAKAMAIGETGHSRGKVVLLR
ncbi:hypothetical protein [Actinoplanes sp. GCM10030250]|uniref:hypothetical protein n=1 Tax=Actinoplanes sp. GCM10030250 TaxID=3273376 RepID=UPI00360B253A